MANRDDEDSGGTLLRLPGLGGVGVPAFLRGDDAGQDTGSGDAPAATPQEAPAASMPRLPADADFDGMAPPTRLSMPGLDFDLEAESDGEFVPPGPENPDDPTAGDTVAVGLALVTAMGIAAARAMWEAGSARRARARKEQAAKGGGGTTATKSGTTKTSGPSGSRGGGTGGGGRGLLGTPTAKRKAAATTPATAAGGTTGRPAKTAKTKSWSTSDPAPAGWKSWKDRKKDKAAAKDDKNGKGADGGKGKGGKGTDGKDGGKGSDGKSGDGKGKADDRKKAGDDKDGGKGPDDKPDERKKPDGDGRGPDDKADESGDDGRGDDGRGKADERGEADDDGPDEAGETSEERPEEGAGERPDGEKKPEETDKAADAPEDDAPDDGRQDDGQDDSGHQENGRQGDDGQGDNGRRQEGEDRQEDGRQEEREKEPDAKPGEKKEGPDWEAWWEASGRKRPRPEWDDTSTMRPPPGTDPSWKFMGATRVDGDPSVTSAAPQIGPATPEPTAGGSAPAHQEGDTATMATTTSTAPAVQYDDAELTIGDVIDADTDMAEQITEGVDVARASAAGCDRLLTSLENLLGEIANLRVPGVLQGLIVLVIDKTIDVRDKANAIAAGLPAAAEAIGTAGTNAAQRHKPLAEAVADAGHIRPAEREYHDA